MKVQVTVYPFGQAVTTEHDSLADVASHIEAFVSLHGEGARVDVDLKITV